MSTSHALALKPSAPPTNQSKGNDSQVVLVIDARLCRHPERRWLLTKEKPRPLPNLKFKKGNGCYGRFCGPTADSEAAAAPGAWQQTNTQESYLYSLHGRWTSPDCWWQWKFSGRGVYSLHTGEAGQAMVRQVIGEWLCPDG